MLKFTAKHFLFFLVLFPVLIPSFAESVTESSEEYIFKTVVESRLEQRLYYALSEIAGTDEIIVIASANVKVVGDKKRLDKKRTTLVLPGVPLKKEIGKEREIDLSGLPPSIITRLDITVLVDDSVPDNLMDVMRDVAISMSGYNPDRGDLIDFRKITFSGKDFAWSTMFQPPHLYWVIIILLGAILIIAASTFLFDPFKKLSAVFRSINWEAIRGAPPAEERKSEEEIREEAALEAQQAEQETPKAFSFVSERHISDLAFLLGNRPALDTSVVVNYLSPDLAMKLLEHFPEEKQAEVSLMLSSGHVIKADKVRELEDAIKSRLDYVMGGESKFAQILNLSSDDIRDRVMEMLEGKDKEAAARLKKKVKNFEDFMMDIPTYGIQMIYRRLNPTMFAQVLKSSPGDVQERVLSALSEGASARLKEEMELSHPLSRNRLRKEKNSIISAIRQLVSAGLIEEVED
jgi:flagellar motor switch protein FliG